MEKYLLEKSRIVSQAENERNYHVFYYLLAGMSHEEKDMLGLTKPEDYMYLSKVKNSVVWFSELRETHLISLTLAIVCNSYKNPYSSNSGRLKIVIGGLTGSSLLRTVVKLEHLNNTAYV